MSDPLHTPYPSSQDPQLGHNTSLAVRSTTNFDFSQMGHRQEVDFESYQVRSRHFASPSLQSAWPASTEYLHGLHGPFCFSDGEERHHSISNTLLQKSSALAIGVNRPASNGLFMNGQSRILPDILYGDTSVALNEHISGPDGMSFVDLDDTMFAPLSISPQSQTSWISSGADFDQMSTSKRLRSNSSSDADLILDGQVPASKKSNARLDIPAGRTVHTIDGLIARAIDSEEVKELKTQKRLLRNREAALLSRERKKVHTERLEEENRGLRTKISQLNEENARLREENSSNQVDGKTKCCKDRASQTTKRETRPVGSSFTAHAGNISLELEDYSSLDYKRCCCHDINLTTFPPYTDMLAAPSNTCGSSNEQSMDIHSPNKRTLHEHMRKIFLHLGVLTAATSANQGLAIAMPSLPASVCTRAFVLARYWMGSHTTANTSTFTSGDPLNVSMASYKGSTKNGWQMKSHEVHGISDKEALESLVARSELEASDFVQTLSIGT